jgi:transposase-like protein
VLVVLDGAKALRKAVRDVLGVDTPVQRCVRHKERNVLDHLPERDRPPIKRRLRQTWALDDPAAALERLRGLAAELDRSHPGAAASLREGLEETLTVTGSASAARCARRFSRRTRASRCSSASAAPAATSSAGRTATCACAGPPPGCSRPSASSAA